MGDFDCEGYNAYSITIHVVRNLVKRINRVGHCHLCGGQGADSELEESPRETLEREAVEALAALKIGMQAAQKNYDQYLAAGGRVPKANDND